MSHIRQSLSNETGDSFASVRNAGGAVRQVLGVSQYTNGLGAGFALAAAAAAALLISVGIVSLFRVAWERALLLTLPAVFLMIASAAGWYPLFPRAMLFLAPSLVLFLAAGCTVLLKSGRSAVFRASVLALLALVVVSQGASTVRTLQSFRPDDGIKPIMNHSYRWRSASARVMPYSVNFAAQYAFAPLPRMRLCPGLGSSVLSARLVAGGSRSWRRRSVVSGPEIAFQPLSYRRIPRLRPERHDARSRVATTGPRLGDPCRAERKGAPNARRPT